MENQSKIFIEDSKNLRFIIQQGIGLGKLIEKLKEDFSVKILEVKNNNDEIIILVEAKKNE